MTQDTKQMNNKLNENTDLESLLRAAVYTGAQSVSLHADTDNSETPFVSQCFRHGRMITHARYTKEQYDTIIKSFPYLGFQANSYAEESYDYSLPDSSHVVNLQVSIITTDTEPTRMHIRIRPRKEAAQTLDDLFPPSQSDTASIIKEALNRPQGLVLCAGPAMSGKSTTLAAALSYLATPERKVCTLEDPIEIFVPGVEQISLTKDMGFAEGVQTLVRFDPDVIMISEISDSETAHAAIVASQLGHLVLAAVTVAEIVDVPDLFCQLGVPTERLFAYCNLIWSQKLITTKEGNRIALAEMMTLSPNIKRALFEATLPPTVLERTKIIGFADHAGRLVQHDALSREQANEIM